jgi:hypothetical protein
MYLSLRSFSTEICAIKTLTCKNDRNMKMLKMLSLTAIVFLLTQCYPEGPQYYEELDLVYSNYDPAYGFAVKHTYAIPDKIMKIDDDLIGGGDPNFVKEPYASQVLDKIKLNMADYGWTLVSKDNNPDVLLAPAALEVTTTVYWGYGGYWDWWYGGWYGWYYPYPVTTSYQTGSLAVTMLDPNDLSADDKARVVWGFIVNGVMSSSSADFANRVAKGVTQAYTQSPYLKK